MTKFKDLSADQIAQQHQALIGMILNVICLANPETRERAAQVIDKMIADFESNGQDTSILKETASGLRQTPDRA